MIGAKPKSIPTKFAIDIALTCDLFVPKSQEHIYQEKWYEQRERLESFQKMALSCDFEICLNAYYGVDLKKEQKEKLQLIHKNTKDWVVGHLIETLVGSLESSLTTGRDKAAIGELVYEMIKPEKDENEKNKRKSILVKLANIPGVKL